MKYKIFTITFLFTALFTFSIAQAENPVTDFLFGNTGLVYDMDSQPIYQTDSGEGESWFGSGFLNFLSDLFSNSTSESGTSDDAQSGDWDINSQTYENNTEIVDPVLTCLPNVVEESEPFLVLWQCQDASDSASLTVLGEQRNVGSSGVSVESILQATDSKPRSFQVSLACSSGAQAFCDMSVIYPEISLVADGSVQTGDTASIQWSTTDMTTCVLTSDDENYADWRRVGTEGSVVSHKITQDTTFKLTCTTKTGLIKTKEVTVEEL